MPENSPQQNGSQDAKRLKTNEETLDRIWGDLESLDGDYDKLNREAQNKLNTTIAKLQDMAKSLTPDETKSLSTKLDAVAVTIDDIANSGKIQGIEGDERKIKVGDMSVEFLGNAESYMDKWEMRFVENRLIFGHYGKEKFSNVTPLGPSLTLDNNKITSVSIMTTNRGEDYLDIIIKDKRGQVAMATVVRGNLIEIQSLRK